MLSAADDEAGAPPSAEEVRRPAPQPGGALFREIFTWANSFEEGG
jgi:hypothetical protein